MKRKVSRQDSHMCDSERRHSRTKQSNDQLESIDVQLNENNNYLVDKDFKPMSEPHMSLNRKQKPLDQRNAKESISSFSNSLVELSRRRRKVRGSCNRHEMGMESDQQTPEKKMYSANRTRSFVAACSHDDELSSIQIPVHHKEDTIPLLHDRPTPTLNYTSSEPQNRLPKAKLKRQGRLHTSNTKLNSNNSLDCPKVDMLHDTCLSDKTSSCPSKKGRYRLKSTHQVSDDKNDSFETSETSSSVSDTTSTRVCPNDTDKISASRRKLSRQSRDQESFEDPCINESDNNDDDKVDNTILFNPLAMKVTNVDTPRSPVGKLLFYKRTTSFKSKSLDEPMHRAVTLKPSRFSSDDRFRTLAATSSGTSEDSGVAIFENSRTSSDSDIDPRGKHKNSINGDESDLKICVERFEEDNTDIENCRSPILNNINHYYSSSKKSDNNHLSQERDRKSSPNPMLHKKAERTFSGGTDPNSLSISTNNDLNSSFECLSLEHISVEELASEILDLVGSEPIEELDICPELEVDEECAHSCFVILSGNMADRTATADLDDTL